MSMRDIMTHPCKPIVGERYKISGLVFGEADDRFHPGQKRPTLVLQTDKGAIYATNQMCIEGAKDPDEAAEELIGETVIAYEYHSKASGRTCVGLRFATE